MPTLDAYRAEIAAELDAFERDLAKLSRRLTEIHVEAGDEHGGKPLWDFRQQLQAVNDRVAAAWRNVQWAREQINGQ